MMVEETESRIRHMVKDLFDEDKIDLFIGYRRGTLPLVSTPCFVDNPKDVDQLIWNLTCCNNLAVYLPRFLNARPEGKAKWPRMGILAKGCDGRSIVGLVKEHQVPREQLTIVGVSCDGVIHLSKIKSEMEVETVSEAKVEGEEITVVDNEGRETKFNKEGLLADACLSCQIRIPPVYDVLISNKHHNQVAVPPFGEVQAFEEKPSEQRWQYFIEQISKCIRCYACRQACPNCYCKECFAEQTQPKWLGITDNLSDVMLYHIGRIFHQAGRCTDCGACVRACPMDIDLRTFTHKLVKDVKELFKYEAGLSLEEVPPLATFAPDDKQEFITEP